MAINTTNMIPNGLEFNKMRYRMEDKKALGGMNYKVYTGDDSEIDGENGSEIDEKNRVYYTKGEEIGIVLSNWFSYKESIELKYPEIVSDAISRIKIGTESLSTSISKGISIGYNNTADFQTSIAIGNRANSKSTNAVQIGNGTNVTPNSLQFMTKTIVSYDAATEKYLINADTAETAKTAETANNAANSDKVNNVKFYVGGASGYSFAPPIVTEYEHDGTQFKSYIKQYKMIYNNNFGEPITTSGVTINGLPAHTRSNDLVFYFRVGPSSSDNSSVLKAYYSPNAAGFKQVLLYGVYDVNANLSTDGEITLSISQTQSKAIYLFKIESVSQGLTL